MPNRGYIQTPKHRAALRAVWNRPGYREALRATVLTSWEKPSRREKQTNALKGRSLSIEHRFAISAARKDMKLSEAHCASISAARKGIPWNEEHRAALRVANYAHAILDLPECACISHCRYYQRPSKIQLCLAYLLYQSGLPVIIEQRFGRYSIDCYVPAPYHLAFEADGEYWHNRHSLSGYDYAARDTYLLKTFNLPTIRFTEREINNWDLARERMR